jgi:hypothetical protein
MKLYAYCVAEDLETLNESVTGVSGKAVRMFKVEDLTLLVSDYDVASLPVTRENALAHAAVIRSVLSQTTPLPFRFGMLATEQQLQRFVTTNKLALAGKLAHVRGRVEMNLKIMWNYSAETAVSSPDLERASGPGTAFLKEKRRELLGDEQRLAQAAEVSSSLREPLGGELIKDEQIVLRPSQAAALAAVAHLIDSGAIDLYRTKVSELLKKRPDWRVLVSGPWPPYSFVNIGLEFSA